MADSSSSSVSSAALRRMCAAFAKRGLVYPAAMAKQIAETLSYPQDRHVMLDAAGRVVSGLASTPLACSKDLVLEAAARLRGLRSWNELSAALPDRAPKRFVFDEFYKPLSNEERKAFMPTSRWVIHPYARVLTDALKGILEMDKLSDHPIVETLYKRLKTSCSCVDEASAAIREAADAQEAFAVSIRNGPTKDYSDACILMGGFKAANANIWNIDSAEMSRFLGWFPTR